MKTAQLDPSKRNKTPLSTNTKTNPNYSSPGNDSFRNVRPQLSNINVSKKLNYGQQRQNNVSYDARTIMRESQRRVASSISMADLFKENVENRDFRESAYTKVLNSVNRTEELQMLHNEHRVEVQKLLLEISRLHDVIYEVEKSKKYELQRLKEQYEQMTYLHLSNLKQSQISQLEIVQVQLKKTKELLGEKEEQISQIQRTAAKEKQMFKSQIETLRNSLRELVNKKNQQLFQVQQINEDKLKQLNQKNQNQIQEMKEICDRELKKVQRILQEKEQKVTKLQQNHNQAQDRNAKLEQIILREKIQIEERLKDYIIESNDRYHKLMEHTSGILSEQQECQEGKWQMMKELYQREIQNLMRVVRLRGEENTRLKTQLETERLQFKLLTTNAQQECQNYSKLIKAMQLRNLQQIELLKVKMALLHENDLKQLVQLYETKIQNLSQELERQSAQTIRLRDYMHEETHRWYENKKHYEETISKLNVQILRLRNGLGSMEKDMKDRLQSQRSAMLLTSKSLIRGAELKNTNVKFYEQQLRKLRQTIQKLQNAADQNEKHLKQQIAHLQEQINKLIEKAKVNESENHKVQQQFMKILEDKENEIKKLNKLAKQLMEENQIGQTQDMKQLKKHVQYLNQQIQEKSDKGKQYLSRIERLERQLQDCKIENEQLYLQNQINHEQAKGEYQKIAKSSMKSLKQFYERRIEELESDKSQLKTKQSADQANIAELVRKYQVLEDGMRKMSIQAKRRTVLEEKIINLGMDNNLVKNKRQLFEDEDRLGS